MTLPDHLKQTLKTSRERRDVIFNQEEMTIDEEYELAACIDVITAIMGIYSYKNEVLIMLSFDEYIKKVKVLDDAVTKASSAVQAFVNPSVGLVDDDVMKSSAYRNAKKEYDTALRALQTFNKSIPNAIKRKAALMRRKRK